MDKIRVSLLGSTGMVGQKMVKILSNHPYIELVKVSGSPPKVGKRYAESVKWVEEGEIPEQVAEMRMVSTEPTDHRDVDFVLSALPNDVAEGAKLKLVKEGVNVISNASPFRMDEDVPLINPELNWNHIELAKEQRRRGWKGMMIKNPNCTSAILSLAMKPVLESVEHGRIYITTMQSVSGAGYSGLPFMAMQDNVIPYIKGEEEKVHKESEKMLGTLEDGKLKRRVLDMEVTTVRVPVRVGHMGVITVETKSEVDVDYLKKSLREFKSLPQQRNLPTAPRSPIILRDEEDRPQPARDLGQDDMAVHVGRIRSTGKALRLVVLGNNLVRGAAGITVLTLEVMRELGMA